MLSYKNSGLARSSFADLVGKLSRLVSIAVGQSTGLGRSGRARCTWFQTKPPLYDAYTTEGVLLQS